LSGKPAPPFSGIGAIVPPVSGAVLSGNPPTPVPGFWSHSLRISGTPAPQLRDERSRDAGEAHCRWLGSARTAL
jgi:hypothetical protein